uniref:PIK-related kinase FAT domain-containing protein n=1 Tax=Trichuris muris TaxID=70415 RepID=A0A5S6QBY9_TRIMR
MPLSVYIESNCPKEWILKSALYRGYLSFRMSDQHSGSAIDQNVQTCTSLLIKEWRSLPNVIGPGHLNLLRMGQLALELNEAMEFHTQVLRLTNNHQASLLDMKTLLHVWGSPLRNESSILYDDAVHVSSVLTWRIRYATICESLATSIDLLNGQGVSNLKAKSLLVAAKAAQKLSAFAFAEECLSNFRTLPHTTTKDVST